MKTKSKSKYLYPHPITGELVTRQRIWQLKKIADGKCQICGNKSIDNIFCEIHRKDIAIRNRTRYRKSHNVKTFRPWKYK